ncbi:protein involved in gliding motility GldG [Pedobacter psychrotolerans]|uniref:Gliding motility-associated ABC transporter substrate-binding protein GldG n=1 Tax=Pedobacter psychrotolerans TaxID=1843235 RepID=A0A4R2H6G6_9SPHI|nr:gliding motility-associated ABC transporter substrate-binding protein GldG [Pedobacter psychrotolerans]TCO20618.1 protein involved in gliding motility GldG [Pedobacter psychrotolerans]GGE66847.1 gliding motility-associated ABC transporter substrate-binding protein GldG [Pedobacter psychrotolerans]
MKKWNKLLNLLLVLVIIVAVNMIGQYVFYRFDFTADKRFTLSDKTKTILTKNKKPIMVTVFLDGELPPAFKRLQAAVNDILSDYKAYSNADLKIVFVDPLAGLNQSDQDTVINNLYERGIEATNLSVKTDAGLTQKLVYPMAMIETDNKEFPVKLFQNLDTRGSYEDNINRAIENLEYVFTASLKKVIDGRNPRIGFTESNGELNDLQVGDAIRSLSSSYEVGRVDLNTIDKAGLDKLNMMIIAKPTKPFSEMEKYKINYFVMNGGRVLWSIDQVKAELDSLRQQSGQMATNSNLNLDDMLFMYGARINYNLIADPANCAEIPVSTGLVGGQSQMNLLPWIYYPILLPDTSQSVVKKLDGVKAEFPSTVDSIGVKGLKKTFILNTSPFNKVYTTPKPFSLQMIGEQLDPRAFQSVPQHVSLMMEGSFPSVFAGRPLPTGISAPFTLDSKSRLTKMIVIGDGDIFRNQVSERDHSPFPLGFDRFSQRTYGNKALLLNIVDYFTDEDNLIVLRNKEVKIRLLDKSKIKLEKAKWQFINIAVPLLLLIFFAIFQHYYRKYKYAK